MSGSVCDRCGQDSEGALFHRTPAMCANALKKGMTTLRRDVQTLLKRIDELEKENETLKKSIPRNPPKDASDSSKKSTAGNPKV